MIFIWKPFFNILPAWIAIFPAPIIPKVLYEISFPRYSIGATFVILFSLKVSVIVEMTDINKVVIKYLFFKFTVVDSSKPPKEKKPKKEKKMKTEDTTATEQTEATSQQPENKKKSNIIICSIADLDNNCKLYSNYPRQLLQQI